MKAIATLHNPTSDACRHMIERNLSRILDIRILEIDMENKLVVFKFDSVAAFEKVKRELQRIGCPILKCKHEPPFKKRNPDSFRRDYIAS